MEKQDTAMQRMITVLNEAREGGESDLRSLIYQAKKLLEVEKSQIVDSYYEGTAQFANEAEIVNPKTPEDYYAEKYAA